MAQQEMKVDCKGRTCGLVPARSGVQVVFGNIKRRRSLPHYREIQFLSLLALCLTLLVSSCGLTESDQDSTNHAKVYKYDGSIQCGDEGTNLDLMSQELTGAGIEVFCAQKGHDGLVRPAVCGESTGNLNVYEIDAAKSADAESLGFNSVTELSEYRDQTCE